MTQRSEAASIALAPDGRSEATRPSGSPSAPFSTLEAAMTERNERLLATARKNAREEIRVTRGDFKGHDIVGLRGWFQDRDSGEMRPARRASSFEPSSSTNSSVPFKPRRTGAQHDPQTRRPAGAHRCAAAPSVPLMAA